MNTKTLLGLIIVSAIAILVDCYAGYAFFLMTIMWLGADFPVVYFSAVTLLVVLLIASTIGLFRFKKWAYRAFSALTVVLHSFLIYMDIFIFGLSIGAIKRLEMQQIFPMISLSVFLIYFLRPSVRRLFK